MRRSINVEIHYNVQLIRFCVFQSSQRLYCCMSLVSCLYLPVMMMRCYPHERHTMSLQRNLQSEFFNEGCDVRISQLLIQRISPWEGEGVERGHYQSTDVLM